MTAAVVDASVLVAALVDRGPDGTWSSAALREHELTAPHHAPAEAANILRRLALARQLSQQEAAIAHDELVQLSIELFPFGPFAARSWELRHNVVTADAWYVALAEALDCALLTLDARLARADGPRCPFRGPWG